MRYRKLTSTGDYSFGSSALDFYIDTPEAVGQAAKTRCQLYLDSFWRALNDGIPMFQKILGTPASPDNLNAIDGIIQSRIRGTQGVSSILSYDSSFDGTTRQYGYTCTIQTVYSETVVIEGTF